MLNLDERLVGTAVMLVEPHGFLAGYVGSLLEARGTAIVHPADTGKQALALLAAGNRPHAAALAVDLKDGLVWDVADELASSGVPFLFITGASTSDIPVRHARAPAIGRPYAAYVIGDALAELRAKKAANAISDAFATARDSASDHSAASQIGGISEWLRAATIAYLEAYGRAPRSGEVEAICGLPRHGPVLMRGH